MGFMLHNVFVKSVLHLCSFGHWLNIASALVSLLNTPYLVYKPLVTQDKLL